MRIDPAGEADLDGLNALVQRAYRGESAHAGWTHEADLLDGQRTDLAMLREGLTDPRQRLLLAHDGTALVGCVQVSAVRDGLAYIGMVTVDPARQGQGLARHLMAAAEHLARATFGATRIELTAIRQRGELISYYERRGYTRTGEERPFPHDNPRFGLPRRQDLAFVVMAKDLSDST